MLEPEDGSWITEEEEEDPDTSDYEQIDAEEEDDLMSFDGLDDD